MKFITLKCKKIAKKLKDSILLATNFIILKATISIMSDLEKKKDKFNVTGKAVKLDALIRRSISTIRNILLKPI